MSAPSTRGGFTLVELVVALVVLTIGMMGLASAAGYATTQVRSSAIRTQRTAAIESVVEELRTRNSNRKAFDDSLSSLPYASAQMYGAVKAWYDVAPDGVNGKRVSIYTTAPQYMSKLGWRTSGVDTFVVELYRPVK